MGWIYCNYRVPELQVKTYFLDLEGQMSLWFDLFHSYGGHFLLSLLELQCFK